MANREKDSASSNDAGYKTESGNHAAGGMANDTTQVNQAPNMNNGNRQSGAGNSGGIDMTEQSIGGQGAQDGIRGTPSGTQGGQSGQGVDQGGRSQQSAQGRPDVASDNGNRQSVQLDPQEPNRNQYGDQQTGATSGEVGDGRDSGLAGNSQSAVTKGSGGMQQQQQQQGNEQSDKPRAGTGGGHGGQHSGGMGGEAGGPLHDVGAQSGQTGRGGLGGNNVSMNTSSRGNQQSGADMNRQAGSEDVDALSMEASGGERASMGNHRGDSQQADRQLGMQGSQGELGHDVDDVGSKQSGGGGSRGGGSEDQR